MLMLFSAAFLSGGENVNNISYSSNKHMKYEYKPTIEAFISTNVFV